MNKGQNVRRGRTRHTPKKGGSNNNNGTGNRVDSQSRGNPKQNLDKYLAMSRDARQAGDRVNEEYYLQFAEHFQRVINERAQNNEDRQQRQNNNNKQRSHNQPRDQQSDQRHDQKPDQKPDQGKPVAGDDGKADDPAQSVQPKIVEEVKEAVADQENKSDSVVEEKPKRRPARKRQPRAKAEEKSEPVAKSEDAPVKAEEKSEPVAKSEDTPVAEVKKPAAKTGKLSITEGEAAE